jgi:uncharacterized protein (TIGR02588 family)
MPREQKRNVVEWLVFGLGTLLTFAVAGFLLVDAFDGSSDIVLAATVGESRHTAAATEVSVRVRNTGGAAGIDVQVDVCSAAGECRTLQFPEVPSESERNGVAVFPPEAAAFTAQVVSYRDL